MSEAAHTAMMHGVALANAGRPAEARAAFEHALDGSTDEALRLQAHLRLGTMLLELGEPAGARAEADLAIDLARALDDEVLAGMALALAGASQVARGEEGEGLDRLREALSLLRRAGERTVELPALLCFAEALIATGRIGEAEAAIAGARALAAELGAEDRGLRLARLELALAVRQAAPEAAARAAALVERARAVDHPVALAHALRWQAEAQAGRPEGRAALAEAAAVAARAGLLGLVDQLAALSRERPTEAQEGRYRRMAAMLPRLALEQAPGRVLAEALAAFVQLAEAERGFLLMFDGFSLTTQVAHGPASEEELGFSTSLAYRVLWSKEPLFIQDMALAGTFREADSVQELGLLSALGVPLRDGGEVIGVLLADNRRDRSPFDRADLDVAQAFADQVAAIIATRRHVDELERARDEAAWLHRLALAAVQAGTLDELMRAVAPAIAAPLGADRLIVYLDPTLGRWQAYDALGQPRASDRPFGSGIARWVQEQGKPLLIADAAVDVTFDEHEPEGPRTLAAAPLLDAGGPRGVLYADGRGAAVPDPRSAGLLRGVGEILGRFLARQPSTRSSRKAGSDAQV